MPRRPKPKDGLTAGQRVALYEAELEEKRKKMLGEAENGNASKSGGKDNSEDDTVAHSEAEMPEKNVKKSLRKPQYATVNVDLSLKMGEIKPLHSMCNGPVSYGADISPLFREIGVPYVRFDCTDSAVSSYAVDISRIFKNCDGDPSDPENYDFETTDRYVEAAYLAGARVIFRLGESIDVFGAHKTPRVYEDFERLARVCVNIIRHYNEKWAGGYEFDIRYFELLNLFEGDASDFEKYRSLANSIKLYDEELKLGGMSFDGFSGKAREFLRYCKKNRVPLDFITVDSLGSDPERVGEEAEKLSALMTNIGLDDCEIIIGKWGYVGGEIEKYGSLTSLLNNKDRTLFKRFREDRRGIVGAAYAAAMLLRLQSVERLKTACFFDTQPVISPFCAIADAFGEPEKPYYSFKAFGDLCRAGTRVFSESVQVDGMAHTGVYACAATSDSGEAYVMLASFEGCGVVDLRLDGIPDDLYTADVYMLDGVKNMSLADSIPISGMKKRILLNVSEYGAVLIKLY